MPDNLSERKARAFDWLERYLKRGDEWPYVMLAMNAGCPFIEASSGSQDQWNKKHSTLSVVSRDTLLAAVEAAMKETE